MQRRDVQTKLPPGPSAPAVAQLSARFVLGLRFLEWCARRYGDLFTLRMPGREQVVFIADPQAIKAVLTAKGGSFEIGSGGNAILEPLLGSGSLLLLDGPAHMRQRRLLLPPLHGERMQRYLGLMADATNRSLEQWPVRAPFPLHPRMQDITFDVILRAVFGVEESERHEPLRAALRQVLDFGRSRAAFIPWVRHWVHGSWVRFIHEREQLDSLLYEEISRRRREGTEGRDDIFSLLLEARYEDGDPMTDKELRDELITLLVAGHETTATGLAWAFELLFRHDPVMIPFRDPKAIADALIRLLGNPAWRQQIQQRVFAYGKQMRWPRVAAAYLNLFREVRMHADERGAAVASY